MNSKFSCPKIEIPREDPQNLKPYFCVCVFYFSLVRNFGNLCALPFSKSWIRPCWDQYVYEQVFTLWMCTNNIDVISSRCFGKHAARGVLEFYEMECQQRGTAWNLSNRWMHCGESDLHISGSLAFMSGVNAWRKSTWLLRNALQATWESFWGTFPCMDDVHVWEGS